jgi:hypothetical protein
LRYGLSQPNALSWYVTTVYQRVLKSGFAGKVNESLVALSQFRWCRAKLDKISGVTRRLQSSISGWAGIEIETQKAPLQNLHLSCILFYLAEKRLNALMLCRTDGTARIVAV